MRINIEQRVDFHESFDVTMKGMPEKGKRFLKDMWGKSLNRFHSLSTFRNTRRFHVLIEAPDRFKPPSHERGWDTLRIDDQTNVLYRETDGLGKLVMVDSDGHVVFAKALDQKDENVSLGVWSDIPEMTVDGLFRRSVIDFFIKEENAFPLHASAVTDGKTIYVFLSNGIPALGDRKGKSTLMSYNALHGCIPLADDEVYLSMKEDGPHLYTLPNYLKLRSGTLSRLGKQFGEKKKQHLQSKAHLTTRDPVTREQTFYFTMADFKKTFHDMNVRRSRFEVRDIPLRNVDVRLAYLDTDYSDHDIEVSDYSTNEVLKKSLFERRLKNSKIPFIFGDFVPASLQMPVDDLKSKAMNTIRSISKYQNIRPFCVRGGMLNSNFFHVKEQLT